MKMQFYLNYSSDKLLSEKLILRELIKTWKFLNHSLSKKLVSKNRNKLTEFDRYKFTP